VKRALEIAAAGGHPILLVGPPGAGKTLLARAFPSILPLPGERTRRVIEERHAKAGLPAPPGAPSRWPGVGATRAALLGRRGSRRPGEVALAHGGALVLDPIDALPRAAQIALAEPLDAGVVRAPLPAGAQELAADFVLLATTTPCPCGHRGDRRQECPCTPAALRRHRRAVLPALRERFHLLAFVPHMELAELRAGPGEPSERVLERVAEARERQHARNGGCPNARLSLRQLDRLAALDTAGERLRDSVFRRNPPSARGAENLLRIARTLADLAGSETVRVPHLSEAFQYRDPGLPRGARHGDDG
jgi:magnesium chelatase family protein